MTRKPAPEAATDAATAAEPTIPTTPHALPQQGGAFVVAEGALQRDATTEQTAPAAFNTPLTEV